MVVCSVGFWDLVERGPDLGGIAVEAVVDEDLDIGELVVGMLAEDKMAVVSLQGSLNAVCLMLLQNEVVSVVVVI